MKQKQCCGLLGNGFLFVVGLALLIAAEATATKGTAAAVYIVCLLVAVPALISILLQIALHQKVHRRRSTGDEETASGTPLALVEIDELISVLQRCLRPSWQSILFVMAPSIALFIIILL